MTNAKAEGDTNLPARLRVDEVQAGGRIHANDTNRPKKRLAVLDQWILARLDETIEKVTHSLDKFLSAPATEALEKFTEDFSTWYIRRSRDRVGITAEILSDKNSCYQTLYFVLTTLCRLLAPIMPYITDYMYINLTGEESVHLAKWPKTKNKKQETKNNESVIEQMKLVREIAGMGHARRKLLNIPLRQPLAGIKVTGLLTEIGAELKELLMDEINIKKIVWKQKTENNAVGGEEIRVELDTVITDELKKEGDARKIIRMIQKMRKEKGIGLNDKVFVELPDWPKEFEDQIKKATLADQIVFGDEPRLK